MGLFSGFNEMMSVKSELCLVHSKCLVNVITEIQLH